MSKEIEFKDLSLEEKVGQLLMLGIFISPNHHFIKYNLVNQYSMLIQKLKKIRW